VRHPSDAGGATSVAATIALWSCTTGRPERGKSPNASRPRRRTAPATSAYFDRPGTSNGPTEAINGRLEHLRGTALGFRNVTNYITRALDAAVTCRFVGRAHGVACVTGVARGL